MDDTELLLLITTAIAAYESVPANGLKVRFHPPGKGRQMETLIKESYQFKIIQEESNHEELYNYN